MLKSASKVTINTGNVLNLIDIKKKAGQNVTEELSESIKLTLSEWGTQNGVPLQNGTINDDSHPKTSHNNSNYMVVSTSTAPREAVLNITRPHDDVQNKMAEEDRKNLKIGVKIFINEDSTTALKECFENVFTALRTEYIENVTLAYNPDILYKEEAQDDTNTSLRNTFPKVSPISLGSNVGRLPSTEMEADSEADARKCEAILPGIKVLWSVLEDYVKEGRVQQLGVADVGGGCLRKLHAWARVKPTIAQINLASCCVVPPSLHAFCRANDVQLLTHADPPDLLSLTAVKTLSDAGVGCNNLEWCARYQVHIKCRGVLALKGYVCKATLGNGIESKE
ncbi:unnamed protein product [Parnassius apollo]|uniref:(apollo) hypothetical protein n=1 Tax=Parnassius apollo TaxID=110799 RepID=A0A8S3Y917_PARAO|nr:unnamed protein product [Parnassius apollo]